MSRQDTPLTYSACSTSFFKMSSMKHCALPSRQIDIHASLASCRTPIRASAREQFTDVPSYNPARRTHEKVPHPASVSGVKWFPPVSKFIIHFKNPHLWMLQLTVDNAAWTHANTSRLRKSSILHALCFMHAMYWDP